MIDEWGESTEKRNAGRECDTGEKQAAKRNEQLERAIGEIVERVYNQLYDGA